VKNSVSDFILAIAQVLLGFIMAMGFLGVIFVLIFYHQSLDQGTNTLLTGLAGVLGTIVTQQSGYFFQRQRPPTLPDPDRTSSTTTSSTTPAPTIVPAGSTLVSAPTPPAAIVTAPLDPTPSGAKI
jgi:hypothetical protein